MSKLEEIKLLAHRCDQTDYADQAAVESHNNDADRIRALIAAISTESEHLALLHGTQTRGWAAFQLLEHAEQLSLPLRDAACDVLREIAKGDGCDGLAAKWRLKELDGES